MILESMSNTASVEAIHPLFKQAFDYIKANDLKSAAPGKIVLEEGKLFIIVSESNGKKKEDTPLESHIKFIDIQIPIIGSEWMGWLPLSECKSPVDSYNPDRDITFFKDKPSTYINVESDHFVVFFPEDGHAPSIGEGIIKKIIVKVAVL